MTYKVVPFRVDVLLFNKRSWHKGTSVPAVSEAVNQEQRPGTVDFLNSQGLVVVIRNSSAHKACWLANKLLETIEKTKTMLTELYKYLEVSDNKMTSFIRGKDKHHFTDLIIIFLL